MAPPSGKLKLSNIDPKEFAIKICETVTTHISSQIIRLNPFSGSPLRDPYPSPEELASSSVLGISSYCIAAYAKDGTALNAPPLEYLQSVAEALYTRPGTSPYYNVPGLDSSTGDLDTPWGLVIVATIARDKLESNQSVTSRELATLASISQRQIQSLSAEGSLKRTKSGNYSPAVAIRFLADRGVPGFSSEM